MNDLPEQASGHLAPISSASVWTGERVQVIDVKDGFPVTRGVGAWRIETRPSTDGLIELTGFPFAKRLRLAVDPSRDALVVGDAVFVGRPLSGNTPLAQGAPFDGVVFEKSGGRIHGTVSILFLESERALVDFDKLWVDGHRVRAYGFIERQD